MQQLRILFFIILTVDITATSFGQQVKNQEVKFLIDTTISIMKNNAVNANKINWSEVKQNALEEAADISNPYEMGNIIRQLYRIIGDFHGAFFYRDSTFRWNGKNNPISDSVKKAWDNRLGIKTEILEESIGYLRIPSMPAGNRADFDKKAQALNDSLCTLLTHGVKGVIIDLRINGGGAMHPMILGVKQLLGNGIIGSFKTKKTENWLLKENALYIDTSLLATIKPKCIVNARFLPIVILIGSGTGSSGEFLTLAFKGRKNTAFFGSETAGYVTVNSGFPLNKSAFMNLSIGYGRDRTGTLYISAIQPDKLLNAPEDFTSPKNDFSVKAAITWLNSQ
jgi:carboxyl-terminal processing protease